MDLSANPSVGDVVHYVSRGSADGRFASVCRAAVVTELVTIDAQGPDPIPTGDVSLAVLNPTGMFFDAGVPRDQQGRTGGTWHWPNRQC